MKCNSCGGELQPIRRDFIATLNRAYPRIRLLVVVDGTITLHELDLKMDPRYYNIVDLFVEYRLDKDGQ